MSVPAAAATGATRPTTEPEAGGLHTRVDTPHGPVHLFRPAGYERRGAGLVIYVHGLYTRVDQAWREHRLAEQFAASGMNALFIAPEAPQSADEEPAWTDLESLIATALGRAHLRRPGGPLLAVGHSGAYRTLALWLVDPALRHLILIDALYGNEPEFRDWLDADRAHKMTLIVKGTARWADPFVRSFRRAVTRAAIPDAFEELTRGERTAQLLCLRSQYGHMELITEGKTLPVVLRRTPLAPLAPLAPPATPSAPAVVAPIADPPRGDPDGGVRAE
ncbi:MAG TPA: hypothetical protein VFH68_16360 [Polyangia bacterium]|nr:hypothetical protein [Polyangia bacterium]